MIVSCAYESLMNRDGLVKIAQRNFETDFSTPKDRVQELFEDYGVIGNVQIPKDWETGHARGFAFVEMEENAAERALRKLSGVELDGRKLTIRPAPVVPKIGFDSLSSSSD